MLPKMGWIAMAFVFANEVMEANIAQFRLDTDVFKWFLYRGMTLNSG